MPLIAPELMDILVCPACRSELSEDTETSRLVCTSCGRAYPVRDGIPVMLIEESETDDGVE